MDLSSVLRRFLYRDPNPNSDIFGPDEDFRNERRNITTLDDEFCDLDERMQMFQEMRDIFKSVFRAPFGPIIIFPNFDECCPCEKEKSPRSMMLKDNEEKQTNDSCFYKKSLHKDLISPQEKGEYIKKPHFFSYSKYSSIKTIHLPDGTVEEHRIVIDNDGNKVTTVRRTIGDSSHEIITKSDTQGIKEKEENFINIDESELPSFEQKWNKFRSGDLIRDPKMDPKDPSGPPVGISPSSPSYWYLIKKFFGSTKSDGVKWW